MEEKSRNIAEIVSETLKSMYNMRIQNSEWIDEGEIGTDGKSKGGLMKTAEALEAIFIHANVLSAIDNEKPITTINISTVDEDIDKIIEIVDRDGWCGSPYFDLIPDFYGLFGRENPYRKGETDFVDAVSFVTTTFIDYLIFVNNLRGDKDKSDKKKTKRYEKCKDFIYDGVRWLIDNRVEKEGQVFWPIGKSSNTPGLYFTYSAVLALTEVLASPVDLDKDKIDEESLNKIVKGCYVWAKNRVAVNPESNYLIVQYPDFGRAERINESAALVYILLIFEACEDIVEKAEKIDQDTVEKIIVTLIKLDDKRGELFIEGEFSHSVIFSNAGKKKTINYDDLTIYFLLLECFCWAYNFFKNRKVTGKIIEDIKDKAEYILKDILKLRDDSKQLWDKSWDDNKYQIYFNQRAIEALTYYRKYIGDLSQGGIHITKGKLEYAIQAALIKYNKNLIDTLQEEVWTELQK